MLTLRSEQLRAFARAAENRYLEQLADYLAYRFPDKFVAEGDEDPPASALAFARDALRWSHHFGFVTRTEVSRFAEVAVHWGLRLDREGPEWVREVFEDMELTPGERIEYLYERLLEGELEASGWR